MGKNRIKIKKKGELKKLLKNEGYDRIAIWSDGTWSDVGCGYSGEQTGANPVCYIGRSFNYDLTFSEIDSLVSEKEYEIS